MPHFIINLTSNPLKTKWAIPYLLYYYIRSNSLVGNRLKLFDPIHIHQNGVPDMVVVLL